MAHFPTLRRAIASACIALVVVFTLAIAPEAIAGPLDPSATIGRAIVRVEPLRRAGRAIARVEPLRRVGRAIAHCRANHR